mgnify:CR=1 FL=1
MGGAPLVSLNFFDFDNDEDLDLIINGQTQDRDGTTGKTLIYENQNGFLNNIINLSGFSQGSIVTGDFDNDGFDEVFMNNIAEPNKLFRIKDNGKFEQINFKVGLEANGYGTGAAVADIDDDGILELLVSHGESGFQPLTLYKADIKNFNYLTILETTPAPIVRPPSRIAKRIPSSIATG